MKQTKAALKELATIGNFVACFKRNKGIEPEVIYITKKQKETLGLEGGRKVAR